MAALLTTIILNHSLGLVFLLLLGAQVRIRKETEHLTARTDSVRIVAVWDSESVFDLNDASVVNHDIHFLYQIFFC